jgi:hypothetical protein
MPDRRRIVTAPAEGTSFAAKMGLLPGSTVWEVGYDDDVAEEVGAALASVEGLELVAEDHNDVVDVVILWWRDSDGDLVDSLVDALAPLTDNGVIWLFTPKPGRPGHVEPEDIADAAPTAGLQQTSTVSASRDWQGTRLVAPKAKR